MAADFRYAMTGDANARGMGGTGLHPPTIAGLAAASGIIGLATWMSIAKLLPPQEQMLLRLGALTMAVGIFLFGFAVILAVRRFDDTQNL